MIYKIICQYQGRKEKIIPRTLYLLLSLQVRKGGKIMGNEWPNVTKGTLQMQQCCNHLYCSLGAHELTFPQAISMWTFELLLEGIKYMIHFYSLPTLLQVWAKHPSVIFKIVYYKSFLPVVLFFFFLPLYIYWASGNNTALAVRGLHFYLHDKMHHLYIHSVSIQAFQT